jgi:hypothetical protein
MTRAGLVRPLAEGGALWRCAGALLGRARGGAPGGEARALAFAAPVWRAGLAALVRFAPLSPTEWSPAAAMAAATLAWAELLKAVLREQRPRG